MTSIPADADDALAQCERNARALLTRHFETIYRERTPAYVEGVLAIDHYRSRYDHARSILGTDWPHSTDALLVSGYGAGSEMLLARQYGAGRVCGVEVEPIWEEVTRVRLAHLPQMFPTVYDGRILPYADGDFQAVMSGHIIEHTGDPERYLHECLRVLAPGGVLVLEFPTRYHWRELHTGLPSLEWLPGLLRKALLRVLASRRPRWVSERARHGYESILGTDLKPISSGMITRWCQRSPWPSALVHRTLAAPGVVRMIVQRQAAST